MSFYVLSGSDRVRIQERVKKILGSEYEVFEGAELRETDLMEICVGANLFAEKRRILIKDLTNKMREANSSDAGPEKLVSTSFDPYEILIKYADTPHTIVIWETNLPRKKSFREFCKLKQVSQEKIDEKETIDRFAIFKIFDKALINGTEAAKEYRALNTDPYLAVGAMASWAVNKYKFRFGEREKRIVKAVAELDVQTKTLKIAPELLVEGLVARLDRI